MFIIQRYPVSTARTVCMINIVVVGLILTKLANLANTKVKREVLVVFINFSPLPVSESATHNVKSMIACMAMAVLTSEFH